MYDIENSPATQRHILKLFGAVEQTLQFSPVEIHKRIKPGFDDTKVESWEEPMFIKSKCKHAFPIDRPEMPLSQRPRDPDARERDYSLLRVSWGSRVVMELVWNDEGWFGHIDPGAWEVNFVKWTVYSWQCEGDDVVSAA